MVGQNRCTIFRNIYDKTPNYRSVDEALERIKSGRSKDKIEEIRSTLDKGKAQSMKKMLPSVRFSGIFESQTDTSLTNHSGFIVLDFDDSDVGEKMAEITSQEFIYAAWVSPSGNGVKALALIADGTKHREHFEALKEVFPDVDRSGINESRICYESFDPHLWKNPNVRPFTKLKIIEQIEERVVLDDSREVYKNLLKWITNRGDAFVTGERNIFLFKLAASCCRFGLDEETATSLIMQDFKTANGDCTVKGFIAPIRNAYKANRNRHGTAHFEREVLVDKTTRKEVDVAAEFDEVDGKLKDVVYGIDVKDEAIAIFRYGYPNIFGVGVPELDKYWKPWKQEISLLTGHGNYGKSAFEKWYLIFRAVLFGEKAAVFAPEDKRNIYFHELTEILLGQDCTPNNKERKATEEEYSNAYDFISRHFFYIYPETLAPTPDYIKEKFLELIIKEGVSWCVIDPFNQMENDYAKVNGRDDKYLSIVLADFKRFAMGNDVFFLIIAHPNPMQLGSDGNYPCPKMYNLAGGGMWNAKMDNILAYHRPFAQTAPEDATCEFHAIKIKDQKVVGIKGWVAFEYYKKVRRYLFNGRDDLEAAIRAKGLNWKNPKPVQGVLLNQ